MMANHGKFYQPPWADYPRLYVSKRTKEVMTLLRRRGVKAVAIEDWENPAHRIDFLTEGCSQLVHLWINTADVLDLSPVSGLYNLEKLVVAPNSEQKPIRERQIAGIDFSHLLRLRECVLANVASLGNLTDCSWLEELVLINCRLPDLRILAPLTALKRLFLRDIQLHSLTGIAQLPSLRTLILSQVSLATLGAIEDVAVRFPGAEIHELPIRAREMVRLDCDEIEEQRMYEAQTQKTTPAYVQHIDFEHPGCVVILVDQSGSMASEFGALPKSTKAKDVVEAINRFLQHLALCCCEAGVIQDYWHVGVIGYGDTVGSAFNGSLAGRTIVPISELAKHPLRFEVRKKLYENEDAPEVWKTLYPVWLDPVADGNTRMRRAFAFTREALSSWIAAHPSGFPPVVVNITDAEGTDGDCTTEALSLKRLQTEDGEVLLFNIVMEARGRGEEAVAFPSHWDEWGRGLFRSSSHLPPCMLTAAEKVGYHVNKTSRGFLQRVVVEDIVGALSLFTAAAGFAEERNRVGVLTEEGVSTKALVRRVPERVSTEQIVAAAKKLRRRAHETLTVDVFWKLIETSRRLAPDGCEAQREALIGLLHTLTPEDTVQFDQYFCDYLHKAYTWKLWGAAYIIGGGCSDDGFIDFRSWLITKGRKAYENALRDPETLLRVMKASDGNGQVEGFRYVAMQVWEQKTGQGREAFPAHQHQAEISREPWQQDRDDWPRRFPKLWRKFAASR